MRRVNYWAGTDLVNDLNAEAVGSPVVTTNALGGRTVMTLSPSDGVDGFRVRSANSPLRVADDFSAAVVFVTDSTNLLGATGPWFEGSGLVDSSALGFSADWGMSINSAGQLGAGMGAGFGSPPKSFYTEAGFNDGQIHLAVVTRQASDLNLYVDGQLAATDIGFNDRTRAPLDVAFGMLANGSNGFEGQIAQVRLFDGQLSAEEVANLQTEVEAYYNNAAPITQPEDYSLSEDETFFFVNAADGLLANDSDPDGDPLTPVVISGPDHGTLNLNPDGSFLYSPDRNYNGVDTFVYAANDFRPGNEVTVTFQHRTGL